MGEFEVAGSGELDLGIPESAFEPLAASRRVALRPDAADETSGAGPEWSCDEWVDAGWVPGDYGDPETDPDDDQAWLAGLPAEVREEFLAGAWTGDGELIPAGFLHHLRGGPGGAGFAAGGTLDTLAPGPWLSEAVAAGAAGGHDQLGESELIGVLCAWRRMSSWAAAGEAASVLALDRRRAAQSEQTGRADLSEHVADELAAALTLTGRCADRLLSLSRGLGRLDEVHAALERGEIDWAKASVFVDELGVLASDQVAREIAGRLLDRAGAGGWTTGQLRVRLRQAVLAADPDAAVRRRREARADADVESWDESSGNAALAGRQLPPAQVIAAMARLTALARWLHDHGAAGTIGQLRAAAYTALLVGDPVESLLPGLIGSPSQPASAEYSSGSDGEPGNGQPASARSGWPAVSGTVHLTMPVSAWLGGGQPGEVAGHGPVDAPVSRELAALLGASAGTRWCLTVTGTDGRAVGTPAPAAARQPASRYCDGPPACGPGSGCSKPALAATRPSRPPTAHRPGCGTWSAPGSVTAVIPVAAARQSAAISTTPCPSTRAAGRVPAIWHRAAAGTTAPNKHPAGSCSNHCQGK